MPPADAQVLYLLTGPTAVGKTELALRWAEANEAEIVSCDSLLFYCGMDIGTAKPSKEELARVPHHLVDICAPSEGMDIVRFVQAARGAIQMIRARGKRVLVTGGSGFYLKAFFAPISDGIQVSPTLRAQVEELWQARGNEGVLAELHRLNPQGLGELDVANPRRLLRALERCLAANKNLAELAADFARLPSAFNDFTPLITVLEREPDELKQRIRLRVHSMLAAGLIEEVKVLRALGFESNPSASRAIGYRETLAHLDGELESASLAETIVRNTLSLVKKQRTWFRTQLADHRVVSAATASAETLF